MRISAAISSKGQIVIPAPLRRKYRLVEGATVSFHEDQGRLVLEPNNFAKLRTLRGSLPGYPFEKALNEERRAAARKEEQR